MVLILQQRLSRIKQISFPDITPGWTVLSYSVWRWKTDHSFLFETIDAYTCTLNLFFLINNVLYLSSLHTHKYIKYHLWSIFLINTCFSSCFWWLTIHDIRRYGCHLLQNHLFPELVRNESALNSTYTCTDGELNLQSCHSLYSLPFIITFWYLIVKKEKCPKNVTS